MSKLMLNNNMLNNEVSLLCKRHVVAQLQSCKLRH